MFKNIRKNLGYALTAFMVAVALAGALGMFSPAPVEAGQSWRQQPAGSVRRNNGTGKMTQQEVVNATYSYGWQVSGPFYASVLTWTATIIQPASKATNLTDGSSYQGPFRVVGIVSQNMRIMPTTLTYTAGAPITTTYTVQGMGTPINASNNNNGGVGWFDSSSFWGNLPPNTNLSVLTDLTYTPTANNLVYWVLDQDF